MPCKAGEVIGKWIGISFSTLMHSYDNKAKVMQSNRFSCLLSGTSQDLNCIGYQICNFFIYYIDKTL